MGFNVHRLDMQPSLGGLLRNQVWMAWVSVNDVTLIVAWNARLSSPTAQVQAAMVYHGSRLAGAVGISGGIYDHWLRRVAVSPAP
jgi:hypothetical protein